MVGEDDRLYPPSVARLIAELGKLPGIGKRSAERLAFHLLANPRAEAMALALAIRDAKRNLRACGRCFNVAEGELCGVCSDLSRDQGILCVVELPRDVIFLEKTGAFRGLYHVLQGRLSPLDGIGPERLRVTELVRRVREAAAGGVPFREVVLGTNPTAEGDVTATYVANELKAVGARVTRLARGLSSGIDLESAAPSSLGFAFEGRREA